MPTPFIPVRVERLMWYGTDRNHKRFIFSQVWALDGFPGSSFWAQVVNHLNPLVRRPFGNHPDLLYDQTNFNQETIWPTKHLAAAFDLVARTSIVTLNAAAPEASFRLQRVGAGGAIGRTAYPILSDRYYTDLPRRRQVDVPQLAAWLAAVDTPGRYTFTADGINIKQVIWNRRTETFQLVTHFKILANPVRIWQRWRNYDFARFHSADAAWQPGEETPLE